MYNFDVGFFKQQRPQGDRAMTLRVKNCLFPRKQFVTHHQYVTKRLFFQGFFKKNAKNNNLIFGS